MTARVAVLSDVHGNATALDAVRNGGYFAPQLVTKLITKCRKNPKGLISERENMALVGILSTQLLHYQFIDNFPSIPSNTHSNITVDMGVS